jgi:hypothetical protein
MLVLLACVCGSHPDIAPQRPPARPGLEPFLFWLSIGRNCLPVWIALRSVGPTVIVK